MVNLKDWLPLFQYNSDYEPAAPAIPVAVVLPALLLWGILFFDISLQASGELKWNNEPRVSARVKTLEISA